MKKKGRGGKRDDSNDATSMIYGDGSSLSLNPYMIPKQASQELEGPLKTAVTFQRWNTLNRHGQARPHLFPKSKPLGSHMVA